MVEQPSTSASPRPDVQLLEIIDLRFLSHGPYSFAVAEGECVGLSGRSGIGKTQLLRALADLLPHQGEVRLQGTSAQLMEAPLWRRMVTMVPADSSWWFDRVGDHFPSTLPSNLTPMLGRLGFSEEVLDWEASRLSTGERQRLALLRALVLEPRVLLLDEPTSALDAALTGQVENLLRELQQSRRLSLVWVSHDPQQLQRVASRIFRLEQDGLQRLPMN